jgi:hypothetical protein
MGFPKLIQSFARAPVLRIIIRQSPPRLHRIVILSKRSLRAENLP